MSIHILHIHTRMSYFHWIKQIGSEIRRDTIARACAPTTKEKSAFPTFLSFSTALPPHLPFYCRIFRLLPNPRLNIPPPSISHLPGNFFYERHVGECNLLKRERKCVLYRGQSKIRCKILKQQSFICQSRDSSGIYSFVCFFFFF